MKAIVYTEYGPPEVLRVEEVDKPTPRDDEVLIRTHAATVVAGDCEFRAFNFPLWLWLPLRLCAGLRKPKRANILGQELAGVVEAVGKDVTRFKVGDPVFAATEISLGAYAEYKCLRETQAIAIKPAGVSYEEAAALPTGGLNALHYLRLADIRRGDKVLINGAAGNIGTYAVQLAKHFGAEVTAVDNGEKLDTLRSIGADHVIDYTREDFTRSEETYDVILNVVGKSPFGRSLRSLNKGGRYVLANPRLHSMLRGLWASLTTSKKVRFRFASYRPEDLRYLIELVEAGTIKPVIDRRYPFEQIADAHRYVERKRHKGNVVVTLTHLHQQRSVE